MAEKGKKSPSSLFEEMIVACEVTDEGKELLGRIYHLVQRGLEESNQTVWLDNSKLERILRGVPDPFPENWQGSEKPPYQRYTDEQKRYIMSVLAMPGIGEKPSFCTPETLQLIFKWGTYFRDECRKRSSGNHLD